MYSNQYAIKKHAAKTLSIDSEVSEEWVDDVVSNYKKEMDGYSFNKKMTRFAEFKLRQIETLRHAKKNEKTAEQAKQTIENYIDDLLTIIPETIISGMVSIKNKGDIQKKLAYTTLSIDNGEYFTDSNTLANDWFCFVILTSRPWEIRLCKRVNGGHTAISRGATVYYAGEILFENGKLISWSNSSGHYMPPGDLHEQIQNLAINHLLPNDKFSNHSE